MVVCKCRKATKLYCFVHKVPVCGECLCFPEHQICVVCTYSEWVIDGDYDWPPKCCHCQAELAEVTYPQTTRLGCLRMYSAYVYQEWFYQIEKYFDLVMHPKSCMKYADVIHTICLVSHVKSFPPQTAPAGYVCPACSTPIWPPKVVKDSGSCLHSKLIEAVIQTGLEKNVFGSHPLPLLGQESRSSPPAFASEPLIRASATGDREYTAVNFSLLEQGAASTARPGNLDTLGIDGHGSETSSLPNHDANLMKSPSPTAPGTTIRKSIIPVDRQNSEVYYTDDEDAHGKSTHEEVHFVTSS